MVAMRTLLAGSLTMLVMAVLVGAVRGADPPEAPRLPRVLLLGDSISIGYTPLVQQMLRDEAVVVRPMLAPGRPENCEGTTRGVAQLARWLESEAGGWDVVHFNFGLHDLKRVDPASGANSNRAADPRQAEPEQYARQLEQIVRQLKATGAKLIFATTTPVPPGGVSPHRDVDDPPRYNRIARKIMAEHGVAINDLYGFALPRLAEIQLPVDVHFTREGSRLLAEEVVRHLRAALADE